MGEHAVVLSLPISARQVRRFTPDSYGDREGAPVYLIGNLTVIQAAEYRRDLERNRARHVPQSELVARLREAIAAMYEGEERATAERVLDHQAELEALLAEIKAAGREPTEAELEDVRTNAAAVTAYESAARRHHQGFAELYADWRYYLDVAPMIAAKHYLRGWEHVPAPFRRAKDGTVPDEVLEQLPEEDRWAIGLEAMTTGRLSDAQRKN